MEINEIWTIKINSGEEIIAKIVDIQDKEITIASPVSVAAAQGGLQLIPSLFTADPKTVVTINRTSVAMAAPTDESIRAKYIESTSGIIVPKTNSKKLILG